MSKKVQIIAVIDSKGKITLSPVGTEGSECIDLMEFTEKLDDFTTEEIIPNNDMKTIKKAKISESISEVE